MPNNRDLGMVEDFCAELAEPTALAFAKVCVENAEAKNVTTFKAVHRSKAIIHNYLAWQDEPGRPRGQAITAQSLRPQTEIAVKFTNGLKRLFS
jgi:hypothetical protein